MDTISARLDLVDTFLQDQELFYTTLQQLQNLSSLDNMLTNIVVIPPMMENLSLQLYQKRRQELQRVIDRDYHLTKMDSSTSQASVSSTNRSSRSLAPANVKAIAANERVASKGISALICIKTTLAHVPILASILKDHLDRIESRDKSSREKRQQEDFAHIRENQQAMDEATIATAKFNLLMGLGVGKGHKSSSTASSPSSLSVSTQNQLLRAIIFALTQPELNEIREIIDDAFTKSTTYTKNANAMKHQECFALKSSDDNGFMDVLRKVRCKYAIFGIINQMMHILR